MTFWKSIFAADKTPRTLFRVPAGCVVYAIGDIHGRLDLVEDLLSRIQFDRKQRGAFDRAFVVFLGDYIDRGTQSRQVVDCLLALQNSDDLEYIFLAGNHEDLMLRFLEDPLESQLWLDVGGVQTLASYGVPAPFGDDMAALVATSDAISAALPAAHLDFLRRLRTWWRAGDYLFVHAGLRPSVPLEKQRRRDLLGIRQEFTQSQADFGFKVVHGHSSVPEVQFRQNRIAVDTGAFATGTLSAAILWGDNCACVSTSAC